MRKLAALVFVLAAVAWGQIQTSQTYTTTVSGTPFNVPNSGGYSSATFEELPSGSPATVSITIAGCMNGTTCDSVVDTGTSTTAAIRNVTFTKIYDYFKVTPSWTGGTNPTVVVNARPGPTPSAAAGSSVAITSPVDGSGYVNVDCKTGCGGNANGQATMANSAPVVIASNQSAVPVSGTVTTTPPSNASTNVAQLAGTTADTNSGSKSAGTLRVVLATDQPALTNKLLVTPDSVALPANQSVNVNQIGGTSLAAADPCQANAHTAFVVNLTANTQLITGVSAKQTYICGLQFSLSSTSDNVALVEGTGSTCGTGTAGMAGGATAATGWNLLANGSVTWGAGAYWVFKTATAADNVCLLVSSAAQVSGALIYVQQ